MADVTQNHVGKYIYLCESWSLCPCCLNFEKALPNRLQGTNVWESFERVTLKPTVATVLNLIRSISIKFNIRMSSPTRRLACGGRVQAGLDPMMLLSGTDLGSVGPY